MQLLGVTDRRLQPLLVNMPFQLELDVDAPRILRPFHVQECGVQVVQFCRLHPGYPSTKQRVSGLFFTNASIRTNPKMV